MLLTAYVCIYIFAPIKIDAMYWFCMSTLGAEQYINATWNKMERLDESVWNEFELLFIWASYQ